MFVTMLHGAFPDIKAVIHDQIAESDMVVTRKTFYGTHLGEFMGVAPTGKSVVIDGIDIIRIADGHLAEHWTVVDTLGLMQQIGALSSPGPTNR
jgi:predicted ester cyclase